VLSLPSMSTAGCPGQDCLDLPTVDAEPGIDAKGWPLSREKTIYACCQNNWIEDPDDGDSVLTPEDIACHNLG